MKTERHERKEEKRLWGPMKGEPNERGQTDDSPNLPSLLVNTPRARKEEGRGGRKERERKKEAKVLPATTQASKDTPKRKGSQLGRKHPGPKEEGEERKERKERERERKGEEREEGSQLRTIVQGHTIEGKG